uniref:Bm4958 n=4 Tax=Brugia TaxID=6278 RepID=A0A0H5SAL9_BRUMA|nr:Bm4958 [Brugia malayi]
MMSNKKVSVNVNSSINQFGSLQNADQVLAEFGNCQRYILFITTLLSINWAIVAIPVMHGTFIIDDECLQNITNSDKNTDNISICMENSRTITPISEFNLRGNQRYLIEWTSSAFMLGNMIGASTLTYLSDKIGRRPTLISSLLSLGIIGTLISLAENILAFIIGRFIQGFFSPGVLLVSWVLSYENVPIGLRGFVTLIYGVMWVVGFCAVAPLVYFIANWRWLMTAYSVPSIVFAAIYFFTIPESLHFLIVNGRKERAAKWIRNAEKYGKVLHKRNVDMMVELLENTCLDVKEHEHKTEMTENLRSSLIEQLMEHKIFCVYTFILIFLWTSDTFLYYGLSNYSIHLPGNKYWNYVLSGLAELPAYITIPYALENFGRKRIVACMHFLVGISHIILIFLPNNFIWLSALCWLISKFGISSSFMCIYVYGSEIFPTTMRNVCLGLCAVIARFGGVIAPYVILLGSMHALLPTILFGLIAIITGILTCILPETKECILPSSLDETAQTKYHSSKSPICQEQSNLPATSSSINQFD